MRILFLSNLLAYGGASKLINDILPIMKAEGQVCELLILTDKHSKYVEDLREKGIVVNILPPSIRGHVSKIRYIKKYIMNGRFDVIHVNLFPMIYYVSIIKRLSGKKCPCIVMTEHSTDNRRRHKKWLRGVERFMYSQYNHVISISEKAQENLCSWLKAKGDKKFSVIENGIEIGTFERAIPYLKEELMPSYCDSDILLLMVGSFSPQKNHETMIDALKLLPKKYKLLLAGEGPLLEKIRDKVEKLSLKDRVVFLGFRKDIAQIMHTVDILVIPSIWEGFGLIAAEAMACGTPIVCAEVPGLSEVVGECALKFNPYNAEQIAQEILKLSKDELREEMVRRGRIQASKYNIIKTVEGYLLVYRNVTQE